MPKLNFSNKRFADLPLHYGKVPPWLAERMSLLGGAIVESVISEYGHSAFLSRMSDPFWFQSLGCVLGMDWHSSGITTSVMGALKRAVNPRSKELGIYICGGKGKYSRETPGELSRYAFATGINGDQLVHASRLTAKVDNNIIQDGYQIYLHTFIVSDKGDWTVIQQGMNTAEAFARRYHWHSEHVKSFIENPHTFIYGKNQGAILNLTDLGAVKTKQAMLEVVNEKPSVMLPEIQKLVMPSHHDVRAKDVNLRRLGSVLALAHDRDIKDFESLLMLEGVGPRTIQSLALVSEVIHGTPSRFSDPARFSFAHGGKDGRPFPVLLSVYDETISVLKTSVEKARIGETDKRTAIKNLGSVAQMIEENFQADEDAFEKVLEKENAQSYLYGGKTVFGDAKPSGKNKGGQQLSLF